MQSLGRRYVRYINDRYRRTGTLWEGRYKSSLVDRETYLPHRYLYIELKQVRARGCRSARLLLVEHPSNAFNRYDPLIHTHPAYLALGITEDARCSAYRALAIENLSQDHIDAIRIHIQSQYALGSERFRTAIEAQLARSAGPAKIGRPGKGSSKLAATLKVTLSKCTPTPPLSLSVRIIPI